MRHTTRFDKLQFYVAHVPDGDCPALWDKSLGSTGPNVGLCSSQSAVAGYRVHPPCA